MENRETLHANPLLRKIKTYRDRTMMKDRQMNNSKKYFEIRRRSKTTSPTRMKTKKSPPLRRLAASLHLPHYRKCANITRKDANLESADWTSRSASLPSRFAYRSPSVVESFSQQYVLEYWPSFDGFSTTTSMPQSLLFNRGRNREKILKQNDDFLEFNRTFEIRHRRFSSSSSAHNEPNFVEVASDRVTLSDQTTSMNVLVDIRRKNSNIRFESTSSGVHDKMKQVLGRRFSAISAKMITSERNGMPSAGESSSNLFFTSPSSSLIMRLHNRIVNENEKETDRICLKEGRVTLISGFHSRDRYMFLFKDLLLIVKENGVDSYALKDKIKLCELWICHDKYYDSITDLIKNVRNSFVIGWPTKNYVVEFGSAEERNSWYNLLQSRINQEISELQEKPRTAVASVHYKHRKTSITRKIAIKLDQTAEDLLNVALNKFNLISEDKTSAQFELWALFGKESTQIRLHGYERPLAILKSHIRDLMEIDDSSDIDLRVFDESSDFGLTFFLKQKRTSKSTKNKRSGAGQLVNQLKKRVLNNRHDSINESTNSLSVQSGKLFGLPLNLLCDGSTPPKVIMDIMEHIFKYGIFMEGIFRKPPNHRMLRETRDKLDCGADVNFSELHPSICASLLKEFLRCLPDSLLTSQLLFEWISLVCNEEISTDSKRQIAKDLIARTPDANRQLLRHILCIFYHVKANESTNHMNSHNLSICIGPSLINGAFAAPSSHSDSELHTRRASEIMKFLIENVVELFGDDVLHLFGDLPDRPTMIRHDSSEESDSIGANFRQATSSLDSLIVDNSSPDGSRTRSISKPVSMNVSHDSGLSDLHASIEDLDSSLLDRSVVAPCRSLSQSDGCAVSPISSDICPISNQMMTKSVDNLTSIMPKASKLSTASTLDNRSHQRMTDLMTRSWHYGSKNNNKHMSESSDSLYESLESTCSIEPVPVPPARKSRRSSPSVESTLVRSASGDHLISIVVNSSPIADIDAQKSFTFSVPTTATSIIHSSVDPHSYIDRYSAVRKPARHRKGFAPSPPQSKKDLNRTKNESETKMTDEFPLIIRCQSNDTSSNNTDSEFSRPPSNSVSNSLYSSTFGDDEFNRNTEDETTSSRASSRLSTKVVHSLNEISRQISSVQNKNASFLTPRFNEIINDSSTLTDTSSEERTPHVSREGSRAHECKQIADTLFNKPERSEICANLRSFAIDDDRRMSSASVLSKRMSHSIIDDDLNNSRKRLDLQQRHRPPSYHEALQVKHSALDKAHNLCSVSSSTTPVLRSSSMFSSTKPSMNDHRTSALPKEILRRSMNNESNIGYQPTSAVRNSIASYRQSIHDPITTSRTKDISWSVREKVNLFDGTNRNSNNEHNKLNHIRKNVYDRLNLDINRTSSMYDTSKKNVDLMTASCYGTSSTGISSMVRFSDSHANYPVVRPPPLTTRLSTYNVPLSLRSSRLANDQQRSNQRNLHYRPNRSSSVHQTIVDRRPIRSDNESFV